MHTIVLEYRYHVLLFFDVEFSARLFEFVRVKLSRAQLLSVIVVKKEKNNKKVALAVRRLMSFSESTKNL